MNPSRLHEDLSLYSRIATASKQLPEKYIKARFSNFPLIDLSLAQNLINLFAQYDGKHVKNINLVKTWAVLDYIERFSITSLSNAFRSEHQMQFLSDALDLSIAPNCIGKLMSLLEYTQSSDEVDYRVFMSFVHGLRKELMLELLNQVDVVFNVLKYGIKNSLTPRDVTVLSDVFAFWQVNHGFEFGTSFSEATHSLIEQNIISRSSCKRILKLCGQKLAERE